MRPFKPREGDEMGFAHAYVLGVFNLYAKVSLSGSIIDTVTKNENLRTVPVKCYGDDTPLTFHDTSISSLLISPHTISIS